MNDNEYTELIAKLELIQLRLDKIELQQQSLLDKFSKHIDFINDTYEGLRNPLAVARRIFKR
jgi:hypothetical protein|tara:strand:+ start:3318 stop:3503 length:186 start_codon:yes stop_codon:yes gene_type:complete